MHLDTPPRLVIGDSIEVHTQYDDSWCAGFEIAEVLPDGYRVKRTTDQMMLPAMTCDDDVRSVGKALPWAP
jgi:hypothetical protein